MTTSATYLSIENNLARYQKETAAEPSVKLATTYYQNNISKVTSIDQFVSNYRLLSYALNAYGLGKYVSDTALVKKVLEQGTTSSRALANTLGNSNWKAFAKAYDFSATGSSAPSSSTSVSTTVADYVEQQLESNQGADNPGVELALYFKRVAPTVTNSYGILADANLLQTAQTIFGLSATTSAAQIDQEATEIGKLLPTKDLTDSKKLNELILRFCAQYDSKYGPSSSDPGGLTVENANSSSTSTTASLAASSILSGSIASTGSNLASYEPTSLFSTGLLDSLQGLSTGG